MHSNYQTPEELLAEESFYCWYLKNDQDAVAKWDNWINTDPARLALAEEAVALLKSLRLKEAPVPGAQADAAYSRLQENITKKTTPVVKMPRRRWWMAAAVIVILVMAGVKYGG